VPPETERPGAREARDPAAFILRQTTVAAPPLVPELRLFLATEVTPLWEATEEALAEAGVPPPYWAFAWAGGQALARYVLDHPALVSGRRVLDFASGSGLVAIAAARAGAGEVTAVDVDPFAGTAARLNATLNGVSIAALHEDLTARAGAGPWELILAGDVCYERAMTGRVLPWLRAQAAAGATVLIGDPGRAYCPEDGVEELGRCEVPTSLDLEGRDARETRILRLR